MLSARPKQPVRWRRVCQGLAFAALAMGTLPAFAGSSLSDELFQQGKALMDQGSFPEACQKFAESLALARRGGTLLNLAVCREEQGLYATALQLLQEAHDVAVRDGRSARVALAEKRIERVRTKLSWLTVKLASGARMSALTLQQDGKELGRDRWGVLQAVDPGQHTIEATAPGRSPFKVTVVVGPAGDEQVVEIPELLFEAKGEGDHPSLAPTRGPLGEARASVEAGPSGRRGPVKAALFSRTVIGIATIGVGTGALAVGSVFGMKAILDARESHRLCSGNRCPESGGGYEKYQQARTEAVVANYAVPVGLALAGAGTYLLLRARTHVGAQPVAGSLRIVPVVSLNMAAGSLWGTW